MRKANLVVSAADVIACWQWRHSQVATQQKARTRSFFSCVQTLTKRSIQGARTHKKQLDALMGSVEITASLSAKQFT